MHNFVSVTTNSARYQEISLNPQKLAGQCGKLKCCLNFELATYMDAQRNFPPNQIPLETENGLYYFLKADILGGTYSYMLQGNSPSNQIVIPIKRVKEIQQLNKRGNKPERLIAFDESAEIKKVDSFENVVGQDDLHRFDQPKKQGRNKKRNYNRKPNLNRNRNRNQNRNPKD
jgi:hypothetical protein